MTKNNWIVAGLSGLALVSVLAAGTLAQGTRTPQRGRPLLRALDLSREQKEQALEVARAAQPRTRESLRRLRSDVRALLNTLTPAQRARLAGRDEARLERRLAFLLSRPRAAARIQRNLER